jgi:hypothetical protein
MLSNQQVYALCQPLTEAHISYSYEEVGVRNGRV